MPMFFLDFLGDDEKTRRVAYASSFGKDEWEFTSRMMAVCAPLAGMLGLAAEEIMPTREDVYSGKAAYPPVSAWLRGFRDAEFVVTDSFHGCVFSIIFNKDFVAIGNAARGLSRFSSLLKMFGLGNRLVLLGGNDSARERISALLSEKIDWAKINAARSREQSRTKTFLEKELKI